MNSLFQGELKCLLVDFQIWKMKFLKQILNIVFYSNPFHEILAMMIRLRMIPYDSVVDVVNHRIDKQKLKQMSWLLLYLCLNVSRFMLISVFYNGKLSFFLLSHFIYELNGRSLHIGASFLWISPISMCKSLRFVSELVLIFFLNKQILLSF